MTGYSCVSLLVMTSYHICLHCKLGQGERRERERDLFLQYREGAIDRLIRLYKEFMPVNKV